MTISAKLTLRLTRLELMKFRLNGCGKHYRLSNVQNQLKWGMGILLALGCSLAPPAQAAERLSFQIGPLKRSVSVTDLEQFAQTGQLSPRLRFYKLMLTPQVQQVLSQSFQVDPKLAETFIDELFRSPDGQQLLKQLEDALPDSNPEQLKTSLNLAVEHSDNVSIINFLRAYPAQNLTVNLVAATGIAIQLNASYLQSKVLSPKLKQDLNVETNTLLPSFDPSAQGDEPVLRRTVILEDKRRKRTIPVDFYYSFNSHGPLVVMSHGFAADRKFLSYLARHLASYGLTVASIEHPGSNIDSLVDLSLGVTPNSLLPASEFIDRPKDVSFVLNELERITQNRDYLKSKFNTKQVVVIGHSFGGYTALALAGAELNPKELRAFCQRLNPLGRAPADWLQCAAAELPYSKIRLRDRRIKSIIAFNPIVGDLFGEAGLAQVSIPTLMLSSSEDAITPSVANQLQPFRQIRGEKYLLSAIGGTHMSVTDLGGLSSPMASSTLVRELMGEEAEPIRQAVQGISLAFIARQDQAQYQAFLTPAYIQSLSTAKISLRLTTELPATTKAWLNVLSFGTEQITLRKLNQEPVLVSQLKKTFSNARSILPQPEYCTGQLDRLFTGLFINYNRHSGRLG